MQSNAPREVWYIRHAESVANAGSVTTEASIYSLSPRGFTQAEDFARHIQGLDVRPDAIVHSTYVRARETAIPTIGVLPGVPVEEWPVQEVQYLDPAKCIGTTQDQRRDLAIEYWERCDPDHAEPGAESFSAFIGRVSAALDRIAARKERLTYVFTHGQFMSATAWLLLTRPAKLDCHAMRAYWEFIHSFSVPNCSVLPISFHDHGGISLGELRVPPGITGVHATAGLAGI